ncbi:NgoFVII family restriction endonuclease [Rummeliibacillus pycnus]|uniref:NgoFVII family restriction endonuclease n=1 Tax=Rummeliibacillus pycnus TaxID=101070 RepID=UPI001FE719AB|nr:NgoFVII family restriction endonuclease [Rummeliibacillus pycnus]
MKIFGALSGLFKDNQEGENAKKPYLYYRNHEKLYSRVFRVKDLTRKDSAFDAVANFGEGNIGIGLKTWIHNGDFTYQKVAEFNKLAPTEIRPLIENASPEEVVQKVSQLRNNRILLDKRQYKTNKDIYHYITRDDNVMNIFERDYDLVQLDSIKLMNSNGKTYSFTDGIRNYKFYASKSVLLEEFDASSAKIITQVPIVQFNDPFELIKMIHIPDYLNKNEIKDVIYLPIYSDGKTMQVKKKSGFNAWNGASKNKGSNKNRPNFEAYITIPVWIHRLYPNFFGFNALNREERNASEGFKLHLPDGRSIDAIITQTNGKSLQTNPQNILGKWILHDVLGLQARELLTMQRLIELGVDSLKISKINNKNFKIELAEMYAFEKWKISLQEDIRKVTNRMPELRKELIEETL